MKRLFICIILIFSFSSIILADNLEVVQVERPGDDVPEFAGYLKNEIVVKLNEDLLQRLSKRSAAENALTGIKLLDRLNKRYQASQMIQRYPGLPAKVYQGRRIDPAGWFKIRFSADIDPEAAARAYRALSGVIDAQPIGVHRIDARVPNDPQYSDQYHLNNSNDADIDGPEAWDLETGNPDIIVAILDTGVRYYHKDLGGADASPSNADASSGNMWINQAEKNGSPGVDDDNNGFVDDWIGWDFVTNVTGWSGEDASTPDNDPRDFNGHGTHCAGIVSAINNNGYAVSSPAGGWENGSQQPTGNGVKVMPMRIGYSGRFFIFEVGYVSMDFAADAFYYAADNGARIASCSWGSSNSGGLGDAIDYFLASGGLIFKSAGNNDDQSTDYMTGRSDIIAVAATDANDVKADFSSYGDWVDISAPGDNIYSTYHDHSDPNNDKVASLSGTSMACPLAAGTAALIWSQNPGWTAEQVKQHLYDTSDDIYGEPGNSSFSGKLGAGRINAYNAVKGGGGPVAPTAAFSASPTSGCPPLDVNFTDQSSGDIESYSWNFGDGGSSTAQNPSHQYTVSGTFTVSLTVTGPGGSDSETKTNLVTVFEPITADFSGSPTSGEVALNVNFSDLSSGDVTGWNWDFGDGGSSTAQNPSHQYNTAGTYTVTLTASNSCDSDSETKTNYITVNEPAGDPPVAQFSGTPTSGEAPLNVSFTDQSSNTPTSWSWDFGEGGFSTAQNPTYQYNNAGTYTVTLTATNSFGSDSETKISYITVNEPAGDPPVAQFSGTPTSGEAPLNVSFTDQSSNTPTSWSWDFGEGGFSTAQNPTYQYNNAGTYTVTLTATNSFGSDSETKVNYISVSEPSDDNMHVSEVDVNKQTFWVLNRGIAEVRIVDGSGAPVENATVSGSWSGAASDNDQASTNSDGRITVYSNWKFGDGTFSFCVNNVTKSGWFYDETANVETCGSTDGSSSAVEVVSNISLDDIEGEVGFKLAFNSPNPFNPTTTINYFVPVNADVKVEIFNILGQRVKILVDGNVAGGMHSVRWNADDNLSNKVSSGFYFYQITIDNKHSLRRKILLLK